MEFVEWTQEGGGISFAVDHGREGKRGEEGRVGNTTGRGRLRGWREDGGVFVASSALVRRRAGGR